MRCDVLIVGAGVSGATLAYLLQRQGKDVMLIDAREFPTYKACSGCISYRTKKLLEDVLEESFIDVNMSTKSITLHDRCGKEIGTISLDKPIFNIDIDTITSNIRRKFAEYGGTVQEETELGYISTDSHVARINAGINSVQYNTLIGADGAKSIVRSKLNDTCEPNGILFIRNEIVNSLDSIMIERRHSGEGYMMNIPRAIYYGADKNKIRASSTVIGNINNFIEMHKRIASYPMGNDLSWGAVPYGMKIDTIYDKDIYLIGEAAGLGDALTGHGIYYAIKSAKIVSEAINCKGNEKEYYIHEIKKLQKEIKSQLTARHFLERVGGITNYRDTKYNRKLLSRIVTRYTSTGTINIGELITLYTSCRLGK